MTIGTTVFKAGGFRYLTGVFQYSGGVAAEPGFAIERVRLQRPLPLAEGLASVEAHLRSIGRPTTAFCACELRSPGQFSEHAFNEFNREYVHTLERWGLFANGVNPVARTNVCPETAKPASPSLHAFAYTVPANGAPVNFVITGGAEAPEDGKEYHPRIVRRGDTSLDGLREKIRYVRMEQERRLGALGLKWSDARIVNVYSLRDVGPLVRGELMAQGVGAEGLTWHVASPPVADCEYEMDASAVLREARR
ncbi:hypothetical protein AB0873_29765 [Micromonospora sp. NPDC047707]|uniref:2-amino-5-chloromuconate deaminase CnbZ n=1 Tax=Micromonospora sp. NPDC047707 TaxID=3154498 RepID=UPI003456A63E